MISSTNALGSLEAALAQATYRTWEALSEKDIKTANKYMGFVQQIVSQIKNITKLIEEQHDKSGN